MRDNPLARPVRLLSLYPSFWPRQGGGQMVLAAIAQGLSPQISNTVLTRRFHDTPAHQEYEHLSVRRYWNPAPEAWKDYATGPRHVSFLQKCVVTGFDVICSLRPLRRLAAESDLVHVHFPLPLGVSALIVRAFVNRPLVVTVHGNADVYELPPAVTPVTRAVLKRADAVVSVSHDLADHLQRVMGVANVTVIPNGVDVDEFRPGSTAGDPNQALAFGSHARQPRVGPALARPAGAAVTLFSISRLVPRKNIHVLIAAVDQLVNEGAELSLVVAGTGPERERIERLAQQSAGSVRFVGFVDEAQKRKLLSEADAFVQLSTREGLSIATLEALASGVPCVVSNLPGVREPITRGQTGWYVDDPENVQSVVRTLREVLAHRGRLAEMKQACRVVAVERYSLHKMCESYWTVFTDLLRTRA